MRWPGHPVGQQLQHGLDPGAPQHVGQPVYRELALLGQLHHRQQRVPVLAQKMHQGLGVIFSGSRDMLASKAGRGTQE